jgi:hypothetical protein
MDISGEHQLDVDHQVFKQRISFAGEPIGDGVREVDLKSHRNATAAQNATGPDGSPPPCESCFGAEEFVGQCCNGCDDVREAYRRKGWAFTNADEVPQCKREGFVLRLKAEQNEGCVIFGQIKVNKVAGKGGGGGRCRGEGTSTSRRGSRFSRRRCTSTTSCPFRSALKVKLTERSPPPCRCGSTTSRTASTTSRLEIISQAASTPSTASTNPSSKGQVTPPPLCAR